eukprot:3088829-Heterocapsa_arctica.AAC.1
MWISCATFRTFSSHKAARPRKNAKNHLDKRSYVTAFVEKLFAEESICEQTRLINLHVKMKPNDANQAMGRKRGEDHLDVYAALAAMTEDERGHFDTLWQKASSTHVEAEVCRRQNASMAERGPGRWCGAGGQARA